jgi:hypothetical protein
MALMQPWRVGVRALDSVAAGWYYYAGMGD